MRALRQLQELRARYTAARVEEIRQVILVSGGIEACDHEPRIHLLPSWKIIGGLPDIPTPDDGFAAGYVPQDEFVDAIA
jgi:hypothetical protein